MRTLTWLAYRLPYGDPLRARLPAALGAIRERIADPGLLLDLGVDYDAKGNASSPRIRSALGMPETGGHGPDGTVAAGDGIVLAPWYRDLEEVWVRPAALAGPDDRTLVLLRGLARPSEALEALARLLSPDLDRLIEADGEPGHPHDPAASVPELVAEVSTATGLSTDAASLYLQLLALPDPTDKNVAEWTGWKPARAKKARAELLASGLVVEAKRPRAGRTLFLPGGWQAHKAPALPIETWKERLFGGAAHRYVVPDRPVPELFAEAWRLVGAGEGPGFEEFTRRGR